MDGFGALTARLADQRLSELGVANVCIESEGLHVQSFQLRLTAASPPSEFTSAIPGCRSR